ncbi:MAG: hypothetical protein WC023_01555 [Rhodocyclaceae bacterium]
MTTCILATLVPRARGDTVGRLASIREQCLRELATEIRYSDEFLFAVEDARCYPRYLRYLTTSELAACFTAAQAQQRGD